MQETHIDFSDGPLPDLNIEEFRPFWEATERGELRFPRCRACNRFHWYPMQLCPYCQSSDIKWTSIQGRGRVYTWTVVRHTFDPAFSRRLPMIVALIEFDDAPGIRLVSNIAGCDPDEVYSSMPVEVIYQKANTKITMPVFRPCHDRPG